MSESIESASIHDEERVPSLLRPFLVNLAVSLGVAAATYWVYRQLPEGTRVPMHWNAQGKIDGYGPKGTLFMMPGLLTVLGVVLYFVPHLDPRSGNLLRSMVAYRWVWMGLVSFFVMMQGLILAAALGHAVPMDRCIGAGLGLLLMLVGNFLGKVRSNFMFGIRTPWTLSSDLAWNKTHRLGGWLFVSGGFLIALSALLIPGTSFHSLLGILLAIILVPTAYSYVVWKKDPNRR
jgi:uncharacterized membrane protein